MAKESDLEALEKSDSPEKVRGAAISHVSDWRHL